MLFSSLTFLLFFLPAVLGVYYILPHAFKNALLLLVSLFFYAWGEPVYILIMLAVICINYMGALGVAHVEKKSYKKIILSLTIISNLGILGYFKYAGFVVENLSLIKGIDIPFLKVILPIGISFYIFQAISYVVDVYRLEVPAQKNIFRLALFISFFPQLVAGPIVKYHDIYQQIDKRTCSFNLFVEGLKRFIMGLGKKIIIANTLGEVVDKIFALPTVELSPQIAWVGAAFYTLQLYYDFSGYSDMAIGLGLMFGFKFLENFNYPYISKSVQEFWHRWHISLSTWFREYVYIPLGGNRVPRWKVYRNLGIVFLLTGLWHGASWSFVVWGLWHGMFIIFEKAFYFSTEKKHKFISLIKHGYVLLVVVIGWVIFRADTLSYAMDYIKLMFGLGKFQPSYDLAYYVTNWIWGILAISIICATGCFKTTFLNTPKWGATIIVNLYLLGILWVCLLSLIGATYNPFIYFRF